jgi:hypothetical protein
MEWCDRTRTKSNDHRSSSGSVLRSRPFALCACCRLGKDLAKRWRALDVEYWGGVSSSPVHSNPMPMLESSAVYFHPIQNDSVTDSLSLYVSGHNISEEELGIMSFRVVMYCPLYTNQPPNTKATLYCWRANSPNGVYSTSTCRKIQVYHLYNKAEQGSRISRSRSLQQFQIWQLRDKARYLLRKT